MAEVSKPSASTTASSAQSPARDPRRLLKQDKTTSTPLEVSNVLVPAKPAARSKSYGEKLINSVTSLSSEVATAATLQNDYAKADNAQKAINRHYEKLRNLSHFPAARDLINRTREAQNKNVEYLKERLNEGNSKQKSLSKQAAALVDEETSTSTLPTGTLKTLQDEVRSTELSLQDIRNDIVNFSRNSRAAFDRRFAELERKSEESQRFGRETLSSHDKLLDDLRRHSNSQFDLIKKLKTSQTEDFASLRRTRERLDRAFSDIDLLNDRLKAQSQRRSADQSISPPAVDPRSVTAIEDRLKALESLVQRQSSSGTPAGETLMKAVNQLSARLDAIERQGRSEIQASVQAQGDSSYHVKELAKIKEQIEDMKALNEYKDTILCDDIEKKQKDMVTQLEQTIGQIKAEVASTVEKAVSDMESKVPIKQTDAISSLAEAAELHGQRFESLETAIGSLESRYGHITAEALAYQAIPLIQRQFPSPQILHNVIERFQLLEMKFSQIGNLGDHLSEHAEAQSRKLDALQGQIRAAQAAQAQVQAQAQAQAQAQVAAARIESQDKSANSGTSPLITQIQNRWPDVLQKITELHKLHGDMKWLDSRLSAYAEENRQKLEQIQQSLKKSSTATDEVVTKTSSMANSICELKAESQAQKSQLEDLTQSRDSQTQAIEQKLTDKITQLQDQIQNTEQKISDVLDVSNLGELKLSLENQEVALQQHVESLSYQLSQLVDQQKAAAADLSQLQQVNEQLKKFTYDSIEELQKVVKDVNHQQTAEQGEILKETLDSHAFRLDELEKAQTPRARNRSCNSTSPDATSSRSRLSNSDDEYYDIESGYTNNGSSRQKKSKRKFSKVSSSTHSPSPRVTFGSTPPRGPASMIERSGPPPFKKRQRSMLDLVNSGD